MSYPEALSKFNCKYNLKTIDTRKDSLAEIKKDYLKYKLDYEPDIIITNPPFQYSIRNNRKSIKGH